MIDQKALDVLEELEQTFQEVKDEEMGFENLGDAEYLTKVTAAAYGISKNGNPMVTIDFVVIAGEFEKKTHKKFLMLNGKDETALRRNVNRFATEMKKLGLNTAGGIKSVITQLPTLVDLEVIIKIETNGTFTNTHVELA